MTEDQGKSLDDAEATSGPEQSAIERARAARPVRRTEAAGSGVDEPQVDIYSGDPAEVPTARAARPRKRATSPSSATKGRTTRARPRSEASQRRTGPVEFSRQSAAELRKVIWPTGEQLRQYFIVVLIFVLFIITFVGLLDLFFGWGLLKLLGN